MTTAPFPSAANSVCCICLEPLDDDSGYASDATDEAQVRCSRLRSEAVLNPGSRRVVALSFCGHACHRQCFSRYLESYDSPYTSPTCPVCRYPLSAADVSLIKGFHVSRDTRIVVMDVDSVTPLPSGTSRQRISSSIMPQNTPQSDSECCDCSCYTFLHVFFVFYLLLWLIIGLIRYRTDEE